MHITNIKVRGFRLLKNFSIDLEDELSLVIGKNNSGKTSLLVVLRQFLSYDRSKNSTRQPFGVHDFNITHQNDFCSAFEENLSPSLEIQLDVRIKYDESDDLKAIKNLLIDLNPERAEVVLKFTYGLDKKLLPDLHRAFVEYQKTNTTKSILDFLAKYPDNYFTVKRYSVNPIDDSDAIDIEKKDVDMVVNLQYINARRDVDNVSKTNSILSNLSGDYFKKEANKSTPHKTAYEKLHRAIESTDLILTDDVYPVIFEDIHKHVKKFGGIKKDDTTIRFLSSIHEDRIFSDNTVVTYSYGDRNLPEELNGLGYMNLIEMIFRIEVAIKTFRRESTGANPTPINILYIEEPEAHTHPQMQYIFIRNIGRLISEAKGDISLQTIISTHSSHIVAESDFETIKYFRKDESTSVSAKNVRDLKRQYSKDSKQYEFLRQYLILTRGELFFADKAILIEGDTERLLLPTMMKKIDLEQTLTEDSLPLLSQNISVVEVGAYSEIFEKFIVFLGTKTLIITDLDTEKEIFEEKNGKKIPKQVQCPVSDANAQTGNNAIKHYYKDRHAIGALRAASIKTMSMTREDDAWKEDGDGNLCVAFQIAENGIGNKSISGRSFEEAFIHINLPFIVQHKDGMRGLKNRTDLDDSSNDAYYLAESCIKKKTHFALDILYFGNEEMTNWNIPSYIRGGLEWLRD